MRNLIFLCVCMGFFTCASYADVKISYISGQVNILREQEQLEAKVGDILNESDRIKTGENSRAVLLVNENTRVWVRMNSEMKIAKLDKNDFFDLLLGKIRAKVKLLSGKKFSVRTPVAVASVRGTEFAMSSKGELNVIEGKVEFGDINLSNTVEVIDGQISKIDEQGGLMAPRDMTQQEKQKFSEEWKGFEQLGKGQDNKEDKAQEEKEAKKEEKKEELKDEMASMRNEMREMVRDMKDDINTARELTNEIKESDLSAGRTLRDVHGNLVRVEQHLLRPDNSTMQLINLTKRNSYNYIDRQRWGFSVPNRSRLDIMELTIKMNMTLPEQLTEWPSYISSKGDDIHPEYVEVKMTNQEDEFSMVGEWRTQGQLDADGNVLRDDELVFDSYINGWKVDSTYDANDDVNALYKEGIDADGSDQDMLWGWGISPQLKITKQGNTEYVRVFSEAYGINNSGSILSLKDFTSSSENPFTLLKQVAAEHITFVRKLDGSDFLTRGNLDLVVTPDLIISIAQKLATEVGDIVGDDSSD